MTDLIGSAVQIVYHQVNSGCFGWLSRTTFADPMAREIVSRYLLVQLWFTIGESFGFRKTEFGAPGQVSKYAGRQIWLCSIRFVSGRTCSYGLDWTHARRNEHMKSALKLRSFVGPTSLCSDTRRHVKGRRGSSTRHCSLSSQDDGL